MMIKEIDEENQDVTTWWHIEDMEYHLGNKPTGESYYWCDMIDEYEYTKNKYRFTETEYDEESGRLCGFWLQVEMPKYLWHLDRASMITATGDHGEPQHKVYDFAQETINDWVEEQRLKHYNENKNFYIKQK
jgi:hypothetical protein